MVINPNEFLLFDGGLGTMLQKYQTTKPPYPEMLNLTEPDVVKKIHEEYVKAGADVISTNTFGANIFKVKDEILLEKIIASGITLAKEAGAKYVALDISTLGQMMYPLGTLTFEQSYDAFKQVALLGKKHGADCVIIETMSDLLETKSAVLAVKENTDLPIFATMTYAEDGRTFLGVDPQSATITLCALGVNAVGVNCSLCPEKLLPIVEIITKYTSVPVIVQPNAGIPKLKNGQTIFDVKVEEFLLFAEKMLDLGVTIFGGCCGTTPDYISGLKELFARRKPIQPKYFNSTAVCSARKTVVAKDSTIVIGERINPTGKKRIQEALRCGNYQLLMEEALSQIKGGADILDVNVGIPNIDETAVLDTVASQLQQLCDLPLQIDSSNSESLDLVCRHYSGKPIINSVNGKESSLATILPIVKKYGTSVVCLTLDDSGIPSTASGLVNIAKKIMDRALSMGIPKSDLIIDCLTMTLSTNQKQALETLKAIKIITEELGLCTVLGVSNISFGLPNRDIVNAMFLARAIGCGLKMAIINPLSEEYKKVIAFDKIVSLEDESCQQYISKYTDYTATINSTNTLKTQEVATNSIEEIIIKGHKSIIANAVNNQLKTMTALEIINDIFIPALDKVSSLFDKGILFLPQLIASAECVKIGFDIVKEVFGTQNMETKGKIILATVLGDVHDIGKNIAKMLLESYGFEIIDLGKDVEPNKILEAIATHNVKLVGLSALMTTTVINMKKTIDLIKSKYPDVKIMVGGAVLTEEFAKEISADYYVKDGASDVSIAKDVLQE